MRKNLLLFTFILIFFWDASAIGFRISVRLSSAPDTLVCLAHYFDANVYVNDTIHTDNRGNGVFQSDTLLPQGLYKIYLRGDRHFDFLLGADQTLIISNTDFSLENLVIEGAQESMAFLDYMKWLKVQQAKLGQLDSTLKKAGESDKAPLRSQINDLSKEVSQYWKEKSGKMPGTFFAAFLMSNYYEELKDENIPEAYLANDSLKWTYQYIYRKNHYFDYFDLTDKRFLFTPIMKSKLDTYFDKVLLQTYDSVKPSAYQLLQKVENEPMLFRYMTSYLINRAIKSRVMGMDALFVDLARDYYLSGKAVWADSTSLASIRENVIFMENNLIGQTARNLRMETYEGLPYFLCQKESKFTILLFYEPDCSHCQAFVPELYKEIYLPYRDKGLTVVAAYTMNDKAEWSEFLDKHQLTDWVNVWDEHHLSRFKIIYDTRTTPSVYLLDENKKIVAKEFSIDFLKQYLGFYLIDKKSSE